jgi:hypothetical protein
VILIVVAAITLVAAVDYIAHNTAPILKKRVVATLSDRLHSPVQLDTLDVSVLHNLEVRGSGLRVLYLAGPAVPDKAQLEGAPVLPPMLSVRSFAFHMTISDLLHLRQRVGTVTVDGLELRIPPHQGFRLNPVKPGRQPAVALVVDQILCSNAKIIVEANQPGKQPLEFDVQNLNLKDIGGDQPFLYTADLFNAKPTGAIHAAGHFGPWIGADPRATNLDGDFRFDHGDLSSIKGISGSLLATGHFAGHLGKLTVDGTTDTPNFALDVSDHPVPLHTTFHALVDGTTGDTTLDPVNAVLVRTPLTCQGTVAHAIDPRTGQKGHDISLTINMPSGRLEDVLALGMKSRTPAMRAGMAMKAKLHIPPGQERVAAKLELAGTLSERNISFGNPKVQDQIDSLSMRAQGKPEEAKTAGNDRVAEVNSQLSTGFSLSHGLMTFSNVDYTIPGATVLMNGAYSIDTDQFEFKGHVRTEATASQMVTGWKSLLLKPVDRFLKKDGAGLQLPIQITGTKTDFHFGLGHEVDETPQQMAIEMKARKSAPPAAAPAAK